MSTAGSYNGLSFGTGTGYAVVALSGLFDLPEIRSSDSPKADGTGYFPGKDRRGGKRIVLELLVHAATAADCNTLLAALVAATDVQEDDELPLQLLGNTFYVYARPRRRTVPLDFEYEPSTSIPVTIEFSCSDPTVHAGTP